jgi:hypothetical protein
MLNRILSCAVAMSVATAPVYAQEFFFRFNTGLTQKTDPELPEEPQYGIGNDIQAYYVAPIGREFSKRIPVTTKDVVVWQKDNGNWPSGISLDAATGLMSGNPTSVSKESLLYHGYDAQGHRIARARLNFTTFQPAGAGSELNLYAHTGQYFYADIPLPSGLNIYRWEPVDALPPGISMLGNAMQGVPDKAGTYGMAWRGFDFIGREVAFVYGELLVQDGPVVDDVDDQSIAKDAGQTFNVLPVVQHPIGPLKFNLVAEGARPPGLDVDVATGHITGSYPTFDTSASFHYVVTDTSDGTQQTSNTFKLSTLPVSADLANFPDLTGTVGGSFQQPVKVANLQPGSEFALKSGSWPAGISMDKGTGLISGTPSKVETQSGLVISVTGPATTPTDSRAFKFAVHPEEIVASLKPIAVRVNTPFATEGVSLTKGNVSPLSFAPADGTTLASGLMLDAATGVVSSDGLQSPGEHSATLVVTNGDGQVSRPLFQEINAYNPLSVSYSVPAAKRLKLFSIAPTVADDSIVGTAKFSVGSGILPDWMTLNGRTGVLSGTPVAADTVTSYAPFEIAVSDDTGEKASSGPITVTVAERDALSADILNSEAERYVPNQRLSLRAVNAYKQARFELVHGKLGLDPGSTLAITEDGYLVGSTKDPVGTVYSNLVARVSDADDPGKDIPFSVIVIEPASLSPLTGSLAVSLTWAKDVPFSGLKLPELGNGYGTPVYAFSTAAAGIILNPATHEVSGSVSEVGTHEYGYTIDDDTDRAPAAGKITLTILDAMSVSAASSYDAAVGVPASIRPTVINGVAPLKHSLVGSLPKGMRFLDGAITGRPEAEGTFGPFTITTTDMTGASVQSTFDIVVGPAAELTASWVKGPFTAGVFGRIPPSVSGAIGKLQYRLSPGSVLPDGVAFHESGYWESQFVGTPSEPGIFSSITIDVTDPGYDLGSTADDRKVSAPVELWVSPAGAIQLKSETMKVRAGAAFTTKALSPTNAVAPFMFTSADVAGLPYDLVLNPATGTLSGKIDEPGLFGGIGISLLDAIDHATTATMSLEAVPGLEVSAPSAISFRQYENALSPVVITNPVGRITYAMKPSSPALPSNVSLDKDTGELKGQPDAVGSATGYVIVATDDADGSTAETAPFSLSVLERLPLAISAPETISLKQHAATSSRVTAQNGVGAVTYSISPALPEGFRFDEASGAISGSSAVTVPAATYTVTATDTKGGSMGTDTATFSLVVDARDPLELQVDDSHAFAQYFDDAVQPASKNVIGTAKWTIDPALPEWATFDPESGTISGTPDEKSDATAYVLTLADDHDTTSKTITLSVGDRHPLEITDADVLTGLYDRDLELPLSLKNPIGEVTWTLVGGSLPDGLEFDAASGSFVGHPTEYGQFPGVTISVADEKGGSAKKTFLLDIRENGDALALAATPSRKAHTSSAVSGALPTIANAIGKVTYSATGLSGTGLGIDPLTGEIRGTPTSTGTITAVIKATDVTKREATATSVIEVLPNITVAVPAGTIDVTFNRDPSASPHATASNAVPALTWTLKSGTLPLGLTINPQTGALAGRAKQIGDFGPFTVQVVDSVGGAGGTAVSAPMRLNVKMNDDPIELSVADYTAYAGSVITTSVPSFDNELGTVTFFSPDVAALGLTIDPRTGVISGVINQLTDTIINVSIKDSDTVRVTSKPLHLQVFPELRLTYPAIINTTQAVALSQSASIGFNIGSVTFSKGAGTWPEGINLDPSTGAISAAEVTSEAKTYGGLTVNALVVFNGGQKNTQPSNVFAIKVNPIQAVPKITSITGNRMVFGTVGTASTAFKPTVVDSVKGKPWNFGGTVYTLNHDLAADSGLTFNASTGEISGTPTKAVIYRDLTITVTSSQGDKATTIPFWFGVAPKDPIVASAGQKASYKWRKGEAAATDAPLFDNWIGNPKYTLGIATTSVFDANTGILSTPALPAGSSSGTVPITLTDEFGRTGTLSYFVEVLDPLAITVASKVSVMAGGETLNANVPTASRIYGTASYSATGLPSWATINPATGAVSANAPVEDDGKSFTITVKVTDSYDGLSKTASYTLTVENIAYYRLLVDTWYPHPTYPHCVGLAELKVMSGTTDITASSVVTVSSEQSPYLGKNLTDGSTAIANTWFTRYDGTDTGPKYVVVKPPAGKAVTSMVMSFRTDGANACSPTTWRVQTSPDKLTWTTAWSDTLPSFRASWTTQPR